MSNGNFKIHELLKIISGSHFSQTSLEDSEIQPLYTELAQAIQQSIQSGSLGRREFLQLTSLLTSSGLLSLVFPKYAHAGGIMPFGFWGAGARKTAASIDSIAAYRSLLLNGEGSIGSLNAFLDSSSNQFSITKTGNPIQGIFTPFSATQGKWGTTFDGSTGYAYINSTPNLNLGTGNNLTIEFWFKTFGYTPPAGPHILQFEGAANTYGFHWMDGSSPFMINLYGTSTNIIGPSLNSTNTIQKGIWYHAALVRQSSVCSLFLNGVCVATYSGNYFENSSYAVGIGGNTAHYSAINWAGVISNLRVVLGTALYSGTTLGTQYFTPPTAPLTAITGTALLTCQDNRFKDNSSNNLSITTTGNAKITTDQPFTPTTTTYSASTEGGSTYFIAGTDYLSTPSHSSFGFGTADFTIEGWIYWTGGNGENTFFCVDATGGANIFLSINGYWGIGGRNATIHNNFSATPTKFQWNHLAVARQAGTIRAFVNGNLVYSGANTNSYAAGPANLAIIPTASGNSFSGYHSSVRVVNGTALYTSAFTPPSAPLTAITNTALLLNFTNGDIIDNSRSNQLTPSGTLTQGTFSPFSVEPGKWACSFNGTNYHLAQLGTSGELGGDFTIELWIKFFQITNEAWFLSTQQGATGWVFRVNSANSKIEFGVGTTTSSASITFASATTTLTAGTWYHVAASRAGSIVRLFINGVQEGLTSTSSAVTISNVYIASPSTQLGVSGYSLNGEISNIRIIKGTALYTSNFTSNTSPLTAVTGTSLLTCQDNRFKDNSSNNFAITPTGNPTITPSNLFTSSPAAYTPSIHGGSMYLATPGGLTSTQSHTLSGDFTAEAWVYPLAYPNDCYILSIGGYSIITIYNSTLTSSIGGTGSNYNGSGYGSIKLNCWTHLAVTRSGTIIRLFINGTQTYSYTSTNTNITGTIVINDTINARYTGYISDARFTNGAAVYTANFTPPTAPLTATINTAALCNFTNSSTIDVTRKNNALKIGNTQISTSVKKYGTGSIYFDGSGDTLWIPPNNAFTFGSSPFTVECWFYYVTQVQSGAVLFDFATNANALGLLCHCNLPGGGYPNRLTVWTNTYAQSTLMITGTTTLQINTWHHMALSRDSNGIFRLFLNGQLEGSSYTNTGDPNGANYGLYVGGDIYANATRAYTGNIDNFTVIPGKALYTANFTPTTITGY